MRSIYKIFEAIQDDDVQLFEELIKERPDCINERNRHNETPLMHALKSTNRTFARTLLTHPEIDVFAKSNSQWTAFLSAVSWSELELVESLVRKGVDINEKTENGEIPLIRVMECGHTRDHVAKYLIEMGTELDHEDRFGNSFYTYFQRKECNIPIEFVLKYGNFLYEETRKKFIGLRIEKLFV